MSAKVAIVTGAAGDIGRAICARLGKDHDLVILADLDLSAAEKAAKDLGAGFVAKALDVTDPANCERFALEIKALGSLTTLVNNAGAAKGESLHATTLEGWRADMALNLDGIFYLFRALSDQLRASHGSITNITSVNGIGVFGHPAYSAAKAGMIHLTKLIAVEYGKYGIRANAVAPGTVRTQAWEARAAANPNVFTEAAQHYALGRIARCEDIAEAVGFLASPLAQAITGVTLPVDCGLTTGIPALARTFTQSPDY